MTRDQSLMRTGEASGPCWEQETVLQSVGESLRLGPSQCTKS